VSNAIGTATRVVAQIQVDPSLIKLAESTFDSNLDGWQANEDFTNLVFLSTGGNPGGYAQASDQHKGDTWHWVAPPKYLGNISAAYGGWLQFDLKQSETNAQSSFEDLILIGSGVTLAFNTATNPGTSWTSYKVPLLENQGWLKGGLTGSPPTQAEMLLVLSSLTNLQIRGEFSTLTDTGGIDNVAIMALGMNAFPNLLVRRTDPNHLLLEWPANAVTFQLEQSPDLVHPSWSTNITISDSSVGSGVNRVTIPLTPNQRYFRLKRR
jgi:hypothetical protein